TALSTGGAVVVSQYMGRRDHKNSRLAARQLVYIATLVSLVMMLTALLFRRPIIRLFYGNIEDDVMSAAAVYFLFTGLSYPFLALYTSCAALFRATGNSKVPMRVSLLVNVLSVGGNFVFIYVMGIGVLGAALSTLISRIVKRNPYPQRVPVFFQLAVDGRRAYPRKLRRDFGGDPEGRPLRDRGHLLPHQRSQDLPAFVPKERPYLAQAGYVPLAVDGLSFAVGGAFFRRRGFRRPALLASCSIA
ncbi:MAG: MATE family efflux transporter, partial [Treponema sp.]|nr:MATE family efflux transporter [Treponema sp.]